MNIDKPFRAVLDATNRNNRRIVQDGTGCLIKVYGMDEEQVEARTKIVLEALNRAHVDPGVAMVEEFHVAFGCVVTPAPWMPDLTPGDRDAIRGYAEELGRIATRLKADAAAANDLGRAALGLLLIRLQLHIEENGELADAWVKGDLVEVLDALSDISYVVDGTYLTHGLGRVKPAADREVHTSNMSKLGADGRPIISPAGRVVKGPGYVRPDFASVLALQGGDDAAGT